MIDNSKARGLQQLYHAGAPDALNALAVECEGIAFVLVKAQCRKYGLYFESEKILEFAHDASAQFIAQYLKHDDYTVRSFSGRIRKDVENVMFGRARNKQNAFEDGQVQNIDLKTIRYSVVVHDGTVTIPINPITALDEIVADHTQGKKIAADLYRSKSYSAAIRRIAAYVDRDWIYAHAEKMHFIFKTFRWRPGKGDRLPKNGSRRVCGEVLRSQRAESQQSDQRADRISQRRNRQGGGR